MKNSGTVSLYIAVTPKRWHATRAYRTLLAMNRLSQFEHKGYALGGVHPGVVADFVLNLSFASVQEKEEYENTDVFPYLLKKLKRYSKRDQLKVLN